MRRLWKGKANTISIVICYGVHLFISSTNWIMQGSSSLIFKFSETLWSELIWYTFFWSPEFPAYQSLRDKKCSYHMKALKLRLYNSSKAFHFEKWKFWLGKLLLYCLDNAQNQIKTGRLVNIEQLLCEPVVKQISRRLLHFLFNVSLYFITVRWRYNPRLQFKIGVFDIVMVFYKLQTGTQELV